jgi:hypothetical protein
MEELEVILFALDLSLIAGIAMLLVFQLNNYK